MIYHWIFGVRTISSIEKKESDLSLDFAIPYTSKDFNNFELAKIMSDNEILKTSTNEALGVYGLNNLAESINMGMLRAKVNSMTVHHLYTEFQMNRDELEMWVKSCNFSESSRRKLIESKIKG